LPTERQAKLQSYYCPVNSTLAFSYQSTFRKPFHGPFFSANKSSKRSSNHSAFAPAYYYPELAAKQDTIIVSNWCAIEATNGISHTETIVEAFDTAHWITE